MPLKSGDQLPQSDAYYSDSVVLRDGILPLPPELQTIIGDTSVYLTKTFLNDYPTFPQEDDWYIGFKITNKSKLGWVKIRLKTGAHLEIIEAAIQR